MDYQSAPEAHRPSSAGVSTRVPSGLRRMTLAMLATAKLAEDFTGPPVGQGTTRPGQVLAAFKEAAPHLGFSPRIVHAVDWLFKFTQAQDWLDGSRPIVWPSAAMQRECLSIGLTQVKAINRAMVELGLVTMKDSPNGRRCGTRDKQGRIVEAYGFDLSPLFSRMAEFKAVAEEGRALRERMRRLRRRATIARKGLSQIIETIAEQALLDTTWRTLESDSRALVRSLKGVEREEELACGVASLERRQLEARERLEKQLAIVVPATGSIIPEAVDNDPEGAENRPLYTNYKTNLNPIQDTVMASKRSKSTGAAQVPPVPTPLWPRESQKAQGGSPERTDHGTVLRIGPEELVRLAPRLKPYLRSSSPAWPEMVEAADWLRHDLGVSQSLWGDACFVLGREQAAIALGIVSAKPAEYFTSSPAGYFYGMVTRAKTGKLNLARTIWGLRENPNWDGTSGRRKVGGIEFERSFNT
ncbi:plasmid replication protein RepC [Acidisphaera sp. L21]|uniref:plasmid replication protein RepC n=1 Tax=Acidisphaera sp. L21 TaxID=1641851 RepID=UPI00131A8058|nr:plasmid replication protein RepC [Acidisphaera sp. L21]